MHFNLKLLPIVLLVASATVQGGNKIIPYLVQTPNFSTWIKVINLCSSPASYEISFLGSDGEGEQFAFPDREFWSGVFDDEVSPGANFYFHLPESEDESSRQGYGEIVDDSKDCIAFEILYSQVLSDGSFRVAQIVPRAPSESGVAASFYASESCDTAVAIAGDGTPVSLEATDTAGEILERVELGNIHHATFMTKNHIPSAFLEDGSLSGVLRILGNVSALALTICDGLVSGHRYVHPLPQLESSSTEPPIPSGTHYEVVSFAIKYGGEGYFGHKYSFRLELKNPTETDRNYEFNLLFRDSDGFVVKRVELTGSCNSYDFQCISESLWIPAGQTHIFEDQVEWIFLDQDPEQLTVEPEIR